MLATLAGSLSLSHSLAPVPFWFVRLKQEFPSFLFFSFDGYRRVLIYGVYSNDGWVILFSDVCFVMIKGGGLNKPWPLKFFENYVISHMMYKYLQVAP